MIKSKDIVKSVAKMRKIGIKDDVIGQGLVKFAQKHHLYGLIKNIKNKLTFVDAIEQRENSLVIKVAKNEEVTKEVISKIQNLLSAKESPIQIIEDLNISSGFIAEYKNKVFDGSARNQLKRIRKTFN